MQESFSVKDWAFTAEKVLGEIWKPVVGWPYEVSIYGRVRRTEDGDFLKGKAGRILSPIINKKGYVVVTLHTAIRKKQGDRRKSIGKKAVQFLVHRLVMGVFYGHASKDIHVNHIDGDKKNNRLSNLEYVSPTGNMLHSYKAGLRSAVGEKNGQSKLTESKVSEIRRLAHKGLSWDAIADQFGVTYYAVKHIVRRTRWDHVKDGYPALVRRKRKLEEAEVKQIREDYQKNPNYTNVGKRYGIAAATVRDIILGKIWKHVN